LNGEGKVIATVPPTNRKGLNRVVWSMRDDPPQTPQGATLVFNATRGPRVPPGTYTVRFTKGSNVYTSPITIGLDRRATFKVADKKAQYEAAKHVSALFGRMSALAAKIVQVRDAAQARAASLPQGDVLRQKLQTLADDADGLRKKIVATKEGGAITGEERLREHLDYVYGAIMSVEDRPTPYQMARVGVLEHELKDVEDSFAGLEKTKLADVNGTLKSKGLPEITIAAVAPVEGRGLGGGAAGQVTRNLLGLRLLDFSAARATEGKD